MHMHAAATSDYWTHTSDKSKDEFYRIRAQPHSGSANFGFDWKDNTLYPKEQWINKTTPMISLICKTLSHFLWNSLLYFDFRPQIAIISTRRINCVTQKPNSEPYHVPSSNSYTFFLLLSWLFYQNKRAPLPCGPMM